MHDVGFIRESISLASPDNFFFPVAKLISNG